MKNRTPRILLVFGVVLIIGIVAAGCSLKTEGSCLVEGKVVDNGSDLGIEGAFVLLDGEKILVTDPSGKFTLETLPSGRHDWIVMSDGYRKGEYLDYYIDKAEGSYFMTFYVDREKPIVHYDGLMRCGFQPSGDEERIYQTDGKSQETMKTAMEGKLTPLLRTNPELSKQIKAMGYAAGDMEVVIDEVLWGSFTQPKKQELLAKVTVRTTREHYYEDFAAIAVFDMDLLEPYGVKTFRHRQTQQIHILPTALGKDKLLYLGETVDMGVFSSYVELLEFNGNKWAACPLPDRLANLDHENVKVTLNEKINWLRRREKTNFLLRTVRSPLRFTTCSKEGEDIWVYMVLM